MPAVPPTPRVKHRAATRRVPRTRDTEAGASTVPDAEPNMSLSRAILVMLLLHVVAAGGVLSFSLIKERGSKHAANPTGSAVEAEDSDTPPVKVEGRDNDRPAGDTPDTLASTRQTRSSEPLTRVANEPVSPNSPANPANDAAERIAGARPSSANNATPNTAAADRSTHAPADSGKTYQVRAGDNPHSIADKFKVDAAALLKLNGIDDPKKLKAGQTLRIPAANQGKTK